MSDSDQNKALLGLTAQIISAHAQNNPVAATELPGLIAQVYTALRHAGTPPAAAAVEPKPAQPAAVKRSIFPDYIICLEDGRKLKTLKRHLRSTYDMSPEQYREKWGLPADYPMVAPSYAERRSALAKEIGLGRKAADRAPAAAEAPPAEAARTKPAAAPRQAELIPAAPPSPAREAKRAAAEPKPPAAEPARAAEAPVPAPTPAAPAFDLTPPPRRQELNAASVFAKFPTTAVADEAPAPEDEAANVEAALRRKTRKPFSKQLSRTMRS